MFQYNGYGTLKNSIVNFNEYPPFTASFQYILLNIKGQYSEDLIITSQAILYLSIIISICAKIEFKKNLKKLLFVIPAIILLPLSLYEDFFINILVDGFLGVLFAIGLFNIYKNEEDKNYYNIMLALIITALALTKTTGIALGILLLLIKIIKVILEIKKLNIKKEIRDILLIAIVPIVLASAWQLKINITKAPKEWNEIQEKTEEAKKEIITRFEKEIWDNKKITSKNLNMFCAVALLSVYSICVYKKEKTKTDKKNYMYILIAVIVSGVIFALGLLWSYIKLFIIDEALIMACYERYMSTVLIAWLILNTLILCEKELNNSAIYIFVAVTIALMPIDVVQTKYIQYEQYILNQYVERKYYTPLRKYKTLFKDNDKIFFITKTNMKDDKILNINKYELMGIEIENNYLDIKSRRDESLKHKKLKEILLEEDYTYVYIYKIKEIYKKEYEEIFEENEMKNDTLYKIRREDNNIKLEKIGK